MIDWTKPVHTKCGKSVRVLCTDLKWTDDKARVVLLVDEGDYEILCCVNAHQGSSRAYDYENVPEKRESWINVYDDSRGGLMHPTREQADYMAAPDRIACVRVEYEIPAAEANQ